MIERDSRLMQSRYILAVLCALAGLEHVEFAIGDDPSFAKFTKLFVLHRTSVALGVTDAIVVLICAMLQLLEDRVRYERSHQTAQP